MAVPSSQRVVRLMQRPVGMVKPGVDLVLGSAPVPAVDKNSVLVKNLYLSLDPAMRGWMNDAKSYIEPVKIGDVMRGGTVGEVVDAGAATGFKKGDLVTCMGNWSEYALIDKPKEQALHKLPEIPGIPLTAFLGPLGMTGMTAWGGLLDVGKPKEGDTVLVSGAAGATGSVVGQIAKQVVGPSGRVVGIAGGPEKVALLTDTLGFDAAVDYKAAGDSRQLYKAIKDACPSGVDVYFDNVGGDQLDIALGLINRGARVVICGAIAGYNSPTGPQPPKNYLQLLVKRARMEGFLVFDYVKQFPEAMQYIGGLIMAGKLKYQEEIVDEDGISGAPDAILKLFDGTKGAGKLMVKIADRSPTSKL